MWQALREAEPPPHVHVFYNRRPKGSRRAADILWLDATRGLINIEVKGGLVHYSRASFRQNIKTHRKSIDPWQQAKACLRDLFQALALAPDTIPHAVVLAVPVMQRRAFTFGESPHILTAEDLKPPVLVQKIEALLPVMPRAQQQAVAPHMARIVAALTRKGD